MAEDERVLEPQSPSRKIDASNFLFGDVLGDGAFAKVVHARSRTAGPSDPDFAIKIMEKIHIKKENKVSK